MESESKIKVSVVVPVYNAEKYLRECLDSILNQTLKELEIYCVDDGSNDNSVGIIKEYQEKDSRVHFLEQSHKGGGAARNLGMQHAKGEYISFIDADDYIDETMYQKLYDKCNETEADMAVCSVRFLFQATGAIRDSVDGLRVENLPDKEVFSYKDMPDKIFNTFHNWAWNKLFRLSFIKEHQIQFQEVFRTNDLLFTNTALMEANRIATLDEYLIYYRIDPKGTNCQSSNERHLTDFAKAFLALKNYLTERGKYEEVKHSYINHAVDGCIANMNLQEFGKSQEQLFYLLKEDIFEQLDLKQNYDAAYFSEFNHQVGNVEKYQRILDGEYVDYLLYCSQNMKNSFTQLQYDIYHTDQKVLYLEGQIADRERVIADRDAHINDLNRRIDEVYQSHSYRVGYKVLAIPRLIFGGLLKRGEQE